MKNKGQYWTIRTHIMLLTFTPFSIILTALLSVPVPVHAATARCPPTMSCGSYTISGLGGRKQQILKAGANTLDLAIAMLETDTMQARFYPYGDGKTGDSTNFGIFKQNWYMLRNTCIGLSGQVSAQYNDGAILNSSLSKDITCLNQSQRFYGLDTWFAGERGGQTGIVHPASSDINRYKTAVYWIQGQLTSRSINLSNDTRFWVAVPSI